MGVEQGGVPKSSLSADQRYPRIVNDWEGLARRMGVPNLRGLTSGEINRGLEIHGIDVSRVVWKKEEE